MGTTDRRFYARKLVGGMMPLLFASSCSDANEMKAVPTDGHAVTVSQGHCTGQRFAHLHPDDRLGDLLNHPAFQGFSRLMLPWDGRDYDQATPLKDIGLLLPYHSHVVPSVVVEALNRMVDDASAGRTVFYNFYTDDQRRTNPTLEHTGLFFFRGKPGAPFAVIAPGGGFSYVGSVHEGFPYAAEISEQGFNAFVLKYRAGQGGRVATEDLAAAVSYIFQNADLLQVGTDGYSLWGSSAGARMAAAIGSHGPAAFGGSQLPKPAVVVMAYTAHSEVARSEPPTFVVVGSRDSIAPPAAMESRIAALQRIGTPVEYHKYPGVGHGFGTGQGTRAEGWIGRAIQFWKKEIRRTP
ncbi:alpha/beta hydrolase [Burkholderia multivorans]|nr:alpha/beta hydrolase [Burkholderia multivorans]